MPGIGETTARRAIESMALAAWSPDAFGRYEPPPRARAAHDALSQLLDALRTSPADVEGAVTVEIARVRRLYDDILRERYDRVEPRLSDLDQLQTIAGGYPSRAAFLSALALEPPQATRDLGFGATSDDDVLILSTAHSAKGREWDAVFVIWAVDGWFPSARSLGDEEQIEEERRLLYVAMTRPRNHLFVTYPLNVYDTRRGADYSMDQLSRFIDRGVREGMQPSRVRAARSVGGHEPGGGFARHAAGAVRGIGGRGRSASASSSTSDSMNRTALLESAA
jgi:DNA helicase-2/ATP-dependent DNA helicase PcrA